VQEGIEFLPIILHFHANLRDPRLESQGDAVFTLIRHRAIDTTCDEQLGAVAHDLHGDRNLS
jgi:hypothetical protein